MDSYFIVEEVPSSKLAIKDPVVLNPTVESTVNTVPPIETLSINFVLGWIGNSPDTFSDTLS